MHRDAQGTYLVSFYDVNLRIALFDKSGRFMGHLGTVTDSLGKYHNPFVVHIAGDSIFIVDPQNSLFTILPHGIRTHKPVSWHFPQALTSPYAAARIGNGRLVMNMTIFQPDDIGYPLHLFSESGHRLKSFGSDAPSFLPDRRGLALRRITSALSGGFWVAHESRHTFERYGDDGELIDRFDVAVDWFKPGTGERATLHPQGPPPEPAIRAILEEKDDFLVTLVWVADRAWRRGFGPGSPTTVPSPDGKFYPVHDYEKTFDTVVEVIDLRERRVLASRRMDQAMMALMPGGLVGSVRGIGDGRIAVDLWQMRLVPANRR